METKKLSVVAHGGAGSENTHSDGTKKAVDICHKAVQENKSLVNAVSLSVNILEMMGVLMLEADLIHVKMGK